MKNAFKKAFPYTIPVIVGYVLLGVTFGILVSQEGYNPILAPTKIRYNHPCNYYPDPFC